jgi:membrane protease YdiL (CAAX protease family)
MTPEPGSPGKRLSIAGLAVAFGWPLLFAIPGVSAHKLTDVRDEVVNIGVKWAVLLVLCAIAFLIRRWKPCDLGIRGLGLVDVLAALGGLLIAFVLSGIASHIVAMPTSLSDLRKLAAVPLGLRIALVLTAAVCEEFIYRGYAIEELAYLTGSSWLAGLLSWLVFALSHVGLYGVSRALIIPALVGAVLTGLYLWRRSLPACMLMHSLMDGIFLILVPAVARG